MTPGSTPDVRSSERYSGAHGKHIRIAVLIPSQFDLHVLGKFQGVVRRIAAVIGECPGGIGISVIISLKGSLSRSFLVGAAQPVPPGNKQQVATPTRE